MSSIKPVVPAILNPEALGDVLTELRSIFSTASVASRAVKAMDVDDSVEIADVLRNHVCNALYQAIEKIEAMLPAESGRSLFDPCGASDAGVAQ